MMEETLRQAALQEKAALEKKRQTRDAWKKALYHVRRDDMYNEFLLEALSEGIGISSQLEQIMKNTALHFGWVERVLEEQGDTNEGNYDTINRNH